MFRFLLETNGQHTSLVYHLFLLIRTRLSLINIHFLSRIKIVRLYYHVAHQYLPIVGSSLTKSILRLGISGEKCDLTSCRFINKNLSRRKMKIVSTRVDTIYSRYSRVILGSVVMDAASVMMTYSRWAGGVLEVNGKGWRFPDRNNVTKASLQVGGNRIWFEFEWCPPPSLLSQDTLCMNE